MELEASRVLLGLLFLVIGIGLFAGAIVVRLRMEKELIGERRVLQNSHFPCWSSDGFSDRGNSLRKIYNVIYFALIVYSIALIIFMKASD
ncbi:MAG: hypothetical protein ACJA0I_001366 [Gammaproteobacteria bacterium]|jgi:hypothetical protein